MPLHESDIRDFFHILRDKSIVEAFRYMVTWLLQQRFIRFCLVGVIGVTTNYSIFAALLYFFHINYLISAATGFLLGVFLVYFLNKHFTFKVTSGNKLVNFLSMLRYYGINLFSLMLGLIALYILAEAFYINPYIANMLTIGITTVTNYLGSKYFVYV